MLATARAPTSSLVGSGRPGLDVTLQAAPSGVRHSPVANARYRQATCRRAQRLPVCCCALSQPGNAAHWLAAPKAARMFLYAAPTCEPGS